jgi:hypothetical protein
MQFQLTLQKPLFNDRLYPLCLPLAFAVHNDIIGVTLERNMRMILPHPLIERIMQKEIG